MSDFNKWRPKYQNEKSYDMKERLAIDEDEYNKRMELYPKEEPLKEKELPIKSIGEVGALSEADKASLSPMQKKILEERQRVSSSNLSPEAESYLSSFSPEEAMKNNPRMEDEYGNVLEGDSLRDYWLEKQDEQRRSVESGEMKPEDIKKFLLVRNMLNKKKSSK